MTAVHGGYPPVTIGQAGSGQTAAIQSSLQAKTAMALTGGWRGWLVGVVGAPGARSSRLAMGLAADLAGDASNRGLVLLADIAGHELLLEVLGPQGAGPDGSGVHEAVLDTLLGAYRFVVADVAADAAADVAADAEPERGPGSERPGEAERGPGPERPGEAGRGGLARATLHRADVIVAVGAGDPDGMRSLVRTVEALTILADADRILPVVDGLPRRFKRRSAAAAEIGRLLAGRVPLEVGDPVLIAPRGAIGRAGRNQPGRLSPDLGPLTAEVRMRLAAAARAGDRARPGGATGTADDPAAGG